MQFEAGKDYLTRNGAIAHIEYIRDDGLTKYPIRGRIENMAGAWTLAGGVYETAESADDLVAERVEPTQAADVVEIIHISGENGDSFAYPISKHVPLAVDTANPKDLLGIKKPPLDLIPAAAELHESMAMANGAGKYGPYNWRGKQVRASIYIAAALRHLKSWQDGERVASDSGVHHLGHARACLGILLDAEATGNLIDDRPPAGAASRLIAEMTKA